MPKITIIVQAHLGSSRLPKKVMRKILGKPMIWYIIQRVKRTRNIDQVIIATSDKKENQVLNKVAKACKVKIFCGSEKDVLDRYYQCAKNFNADPIIRITSDCPLIDPKIIEKMLDFYLKHDYDYVSNTIKPTFPDGLDVEIFSFDALKNAVQNAKWESEREHVTPFIKKNSKRFKLYNFENNEDLSNYRWTVDQKEDLVFIRKIYHLLKPKHVFSSKDVLRLILDNPKLLRINQKIKRDEGYTKSIKNDRIVKHSMK